MCAASLARFAIVLHFRQISERAARASFPARFRLFRLRCASPFARVFSRLRPVQVSIEQTATALKMRESRLNMIGFGLLAIVLERRQHHYSTSRDALRSSSCELFSPRLAV